MKAILSIAFLMAMFYAYSDAQLPDCPFPNGQYPTFFAHPDNCNHYFVCDHGEPIPMRCPENMYFNAKLFVCDWKNNVDCKMDSS